MRHANWMEEDERKEAGPETIDRVAIRFLGEVFSLPRPKRHHDVIRHIVTTKPHIQTVAGGAQGFITSNGRFVDREEALVIAIRQDQIKVKTGSPQRLYSEDLW